MTADEHHVAWADRLGLNKIWFKDIVSCSESYGTAYYPQCVHRFRNDIINIKGGPNLSDMIDDYVNGKLSGWKESALVNWIEKYPDLYHDDAWVERARSDIETKACELLCKFMVQLLEDHGFGFYESSIEEDEMH